MRVTLPILASAAVASAQGINFSKVFAKQPELKTAQPTTTAPVNLAATASSIVSVLSERHAKTAIPKHTTLKTASKKPVATSKPKPKPKPTPKANGGKSGGKTKSKRQATQGTCAPQTILYGYTPTPNTPTGFLTDVSLANQALAVLAPAGYTKSFAGQFGSMYAPGYLTYYPLPSYSPANCSTFCEATPGCTSYNLYFERDPILDPNSSNCPNPTASSSVRCALYGSTITAAQAKNIGEWRADFMVVIQGSNGYLKNTAPAAISGYTGPTALAGMVNVNTLNGKTVFAGSGYYPGTYDPTKCSALCTSTTAANKAAAIAALNSTYQVCSYVNSAILSLNGVNQGTYCSLYSDAGVAAYATQYTAVNAGVTYDIIYSYGYALNAVDSGLTGVTTTSRAPSSTTAASTTTSAASTTRSLSAATPTGASCSQLGGVAYTDLNGITYNTKCGYDLLNVGDIGNAVVKSYSDCFSLCDLTTGCDGFAYVGSAKYCYMKSLTGVTTVPNANSAVDLAWLPSKFTDRSAVTSSSTTTTTAPTTAAAATTTAARTTTTSSTITTSAVAATSSPFYITLSGNTGNPYNGLSLVKQNYASGGSTYYYLTIGPKATQNRFQLDTGTANLLLATDNTYIGTQTPITSSAPRSYLYFQNTVSSGTGNPNFFLNTSTNILTFTDLSNVPGQLITCNDLVGYILISTSVPTGCVAWTLTTSSS